MNILNISMCVVVITITIIYLQLYNFALSQNILGLPYVQWVINNNSILDVILVVIFSILAYMNKSSMNILIPTIISIVCVIFKFILFTIVKNNEDDQTNPQFYTLISLNIVPLLVAIYILFISF